MDTKLIKIFVKKNCPKCEMFKETMLPKIKENWKVKMFDLGTADGLAEGTYYDVVHTPTLIMEENGKEIKRYNSIMEAEKDLVVLKEVK